MPIATMLLGMTMLLADNSPRFELATPLTGVAGVMIDAQNNGVGVAQQTARATGTQARILWIDCTANLDRYNTEAKIVALIEQIRSVGFNTVVFDVKPISGQVVYNSKIAPKLTEWRGRTMAAEFDPLPIFTRECRSAGLPLFVSINAFSEGHRNFKVGPGYALTDRQTVLYESRPVLVAPDETRFPIAPGMNAYEKDSISICSNLDRVPADLIEPFRVVMRPNGRVLDGFEFVPGFTPTVPAGSLILAGSGAAAEFLRKAANPGQKIEIDTDASFVPISERPNQQIPLMMNPNHPDVQAYCRDIVRELTTNYDIDGIIYDDRLRYGGINADFSQITRELFEKKVGAKLTWPDDVFKFTATPSLTRGMKPGRYYSQWLAWRAERLQTFVREIRGLMQEIKPNTQLGVYAGSWYGEYPNIGSNWASPQAEPGFLFSSPEYRKTGFAADVDFLITGCYYPTATIYDAMTRGTNIGSTVEASGMLSNRLVQDQSWTYAGIMLSDFKGEPDALAAAMQAACASTQGLMVFDLSHDIEPMWPVFSRAFSQPRSAPHSFPGLLGEVRKRRVALDKAGYRPPAIPIAAGTSGTGQ